MTKYGGTCMEKIKYRTAISFFIKRKLWEYFRIRFDIDKRLKKHYKKCKWNNIGCNKHSFNCDVYISCGPGVQCDNPCPACLVWTGYGLNHDIDNECHKWAAKHLTKKKVWRVL